jgi:hypothetical protein
LRSTWFVVAIVLCLAAPARADGVTKLFPLSGSTLPRSLRAVPAELTRVLAKQFDAEVGNVPIEDAVELMECDLGARTCVERVAKSVGASKVIFGRIERRAAGMVLELSQFSAAQGLTRRTIVLDGDTADALATSLTERLDERPKSKEPKQPIDELPPTTKPLPEPVQTPGVVTTGTWAMVIGGGATVAAGAGFLLSANRLAAQVRRAPTETRADIDRLRALEQAGKSRTQIGGALMAVGGVVTTIGIVRMVMQRRESQTEKPLIDVVPEQGGASVLFTVGWR